MLSVMTMPTSLTGNDRLIEAQQQRFIADRLEALYFRRIAREIARAMRQGGRAIELGNRPDIMSQHEAALTGIMFEMWNESALMSSERILGTVRQSRRGPQDRKRFNVQATQVMDGVMREWVRTYGIRKIKQITETTQTEIMTAVNHGIKEGLSEREIARLIYAVATTKSASRAQTIARTEVHSASQASSHASAELIGVRMVKVWLTAQDDRAREDHLEVNEQAVELNERFVVGIDRLLYPGDPTGSAEQVINCRCVAAYELPE